MSYKCKCGNTSDFFTKIPSFKSNNTGLYCSKCGKWIKWMSKDEIRAFEHSQETKSYPSYLDRPKIHVRTIEDRLKEFISFLDEEINKREKYQETTSYQEYNSLTREIFILERDKNALNNILNDKEWNGEK